MAWIGNQPNLFNYTLGVEKFNGDDACTQFTIARSVGSASDVEVLVNNVQQEPDVAYSLTAGVITFTEAPSTGSNNIIVVYRAPTVVSFLNLNGANLISQTVTTDKIADGAITSAKIADGTVVAADIAANSVTTSELANDAVQANNILNYSVSSVKMSNTGVTAAQYGGDQAIPVITIDDAGRVTAASNVSYTDPIAISMLLGGLT